MAHTTNKQYIQMLGPPKISGYCLRESLPQTMTIRNIVLTQHSANDSLKTGIHSDWWRSVGILSTLNLIKQAS